MKIQMKTIIASPNFTAVEGSIIDVLEKQGKALVAGGYAVSLEPESLMKEVKTVEIPVKTRQTATKKKPETAVKK